MSSAQVVLQAVGSGVSLSPVLPLAPRPIRVQMGAPSNVMLVNPLAIATVMTVATGEFSFTGHAATLTKGGTPGVSGNNWMPWLYAGGFA